MFALRNILDAPVETPDRQSAKLEMGTQNGGCAL